MSTSNTSRIAKNTLLLYFRQILIMLVSLYTVRIVLNVLGAEDYGIYNVTAGVVTMFGFLSGAMATASQRYFAFDLGKQDYEHLKTTFSVTFQIYVLLAVIIVVLAETVGLWFVMNKLVIPPERMTAAIWIYQAAVVSFLLTLITTPYMASIIAHENMNIYAYVSIVEAVFKLAIVFLLQVLSFDKLVLYGLLLMGVSLINTTIYRVYCKKHYSECKFQFVKDKALFKELVSYSGFDLYGNMSVMLRTQGVNVLLNMFFGPVMNAAAGIASMVQNAVMNLSNNIITASRPQIIKAYAAKEIDSMLNLLYETQKFAFILISFLTIPIIVERNFILGQWLKDVPTCTSVICIYVLAFNIFANQSNILAGVIHATGKIYRLSFINGTLYLLVIPISYISFKFGGNYWTSFLFNVCAVFLGMLSNAWTIHLYIPQFSLKIFLVKNLIPCVTTFTVTITLCFLVSNYFESGFLRAIIVFVLSSAVLFLISFFFILSKDMKQKTKLFFKNKLWKNR